MGALDLRTGFKVGDWQVYPMRGELVRNGESHHIEPKVMDVLMLLSRSPGQVVERDRLISEIWEGRFVSDDPLSKCIAELRKVLGDSARDPSYIRTLHKRGYQLIAPIASLELETTADAVRQSSKAKKPTRLPLVLVAAAFAVGLSYFAWQLRAGLGEGSPPPAESVPGSDISVVAILPLKNLSEHERDVYLADGIHDQLLTRLARIGGLRVISRTSVQQYRNTSTTIPEIGKALGATAIVEGTVQRDADRIRINVQLIDARTDEHLWAGRYDRDLTLADLFAVQDEIVSGIAFELEAALGASTQPDIAAMPTSSFAAYSAYLKGRREVADESVESLYAAISYFDQAIELDRDFALAYAAAADAYLTLGEFFLGGLTIEDSIQRAEPLLKRAMELDPQNAQANAAVGLLRLMEVDAAEAEKAFNRAIVLQPSYPRVYRLLGRMRWKQGRQDDAIELAEQALELDPWSGSTNLDLARYYDRSGRFEEAMAQYVRVVNIQPDNAFAYLHIAAVKYLAYGEVAESVAWYHEAAARDRLSASVQAVPAMAYMELGYPDVAETWIDRGMELGPDTFWPRVSSMYQNLYVGDKPSALDDARAMLSVYSRAASGLQFLASDDRVNGKPEVALSRYATAHPELTEPDVPQVNPSNYIAAVDLAAVLIDLADRNRADLLLAAALETMSGMTRLGTHGYWVNDVRAYALQGRTDLALSALRRAIDEGWRVHAWYHFEHDAALGSIRQEPAFIQMREEVMQDLTNQVRRFEIIKAGGELAPPPEI